MKKEQNLQEPPKQALNIPVVMPCGIWEIFNGQELHTSDLVWFKNSGLAFVDSSLTTKDPDRFTSIPESWSFGSSVMVNQRKYDKYGSSHVRKNGWVYRDKDWIDEKTPAKWDKITHFMRVCRP